MMVRNVNLFKPILFLGVGEALLWFLSLELEHQDINVGYTTLRDQCGFGPKELS